MQKDVENRGMLNIWAALPTKTLPEAEMFYKRALYIDQTALGPDHPETARQK